MALTVIHQKYQAALHPYIDPGQSSGRQWEYLKEPENRWLLTTAAAGFTTALFLGAKGGQHCYQYQSEKSNPSGSQTFWESIKTYLVLGILVATPVGMCVGIDLAIQHRLLETSWKHIQWRETRINSRIDAIVKESFKNDPVWQQFLCPFSKEPIWMPMRTPSGVVLDESSLDECINPETHTIKEIYNKRVHEPSCDAQVPMVFEKGAVLQDKEMTIVLYKRFSHLLEQQHLSQITPNSLEHAQIRQYIGCLEKAITTLYEACETEMQQLKHQHQKSSASKDEREQIEAFFDRELKGFKSICGTYPLQEVNWDQKIDWMETFNIRWTRKYHS